MITPPPETPVAEETLDQISRRLVVESGLRLYGKRRQSLEDLIFAALRNRDERAVRIIIKRDLPARQRQPSSGRRSTM